MDGKNIFDRLFRQLVVLYAELVRVILNRHVNRYIKETHEGESIKIQRRLSQQIEQISSAAVHRDHVELVESAIVACSTETPGQRQQMPVFSRIWTTLSSYFRRNRRGSVSHSCMSDKLKESTREHLHAALRLARQDKPEQARFHADIVTNALNAAAHYMPEDELKAFSAEIEESLNKIKLL